MDTAEFHMGTHTGYTRNEDSKEPIQLKVVISGSAGT